MAEKKKMSVAEILAAARKQDGGGTTDEPPPAPTETAPAESSAPDAAEVASSEPVAEKPKPKSKPGERLSVADILAQARGENKVEKTPVAKKPAAAKPAAKAQAAAKQKAAPAKTAERMDTASILAAARGAGTKRGPVSKAEAPDLGSPKAPAKAAKVKPPAPVLPEKPAYATPQPKAAAQPDEGRRFVLMGIFGTLFGSFLATGMTLMTSTFGLWTLATARFMFPNILTEPPSEFRVGPPDNFAPGQVETKYKAQFGVWIVNYIYQGQQSIFALSTVCTHLGCTPNWLEAEQKFKCPCHGSGFYKDGINFEGPAPRPLERYSIRLADDGQIEIDKSRKFQEEMGQWEDPASYVPV